MQQSDFREFSALLTDVLAYYRQDASKFVLGLWWNACQPFDFEQIRAAMQRHCTDAERGQFAPKVADIARILQGTPTERAALAWGKAQDAASRVGAYTDVVFDDPAIHAVIEDLGGWPKFCRCDVSETSYLQHRFMQSHTAYAGRGEFAYPRILMGDRSPDEMYRRRGLPPPAPALIGDARRAEQVALQGRSGGKTPISLPGGSCVADMAALTLLPAVNEGAPA